MYRMIAMKQSTASLFNSEDINLRRGAVIGVCFQCQDHKKERQSKNVSVKQPLTVLSFQTKRGLKIRMTSYRSEFNEI
jgi:hypothetical protein